MMDWLLEIIIQHGVFVGAFFGLLYKTEKRNEAREEMYQRTIAKNQEVITKQSEAFAGMSGDMRDIKSMVSKIKDRLP